MNSHLCCAQVRSLARVLIPASCSSLQCPSPSPTSRTDAPQWPLLDPLPSPSLTQSHTLHPPPASFLCLPHLPSSGSHFSLLSELTLLSQPVCITHQGTQACSPLFPWLLAIAESCVIIYCLLLSTVISSFLSLHDDLETKLKIWLF